MPPDITMMIVHVLMIGWVLSARMQCQCWYVDFRRLFMLRGVTYMWVYLDTYAHGILTTCWTVTDAQTPNTLLQI